MKKTGNITVSAIMITVSFIFLYMASVIPSGKLICLSVATVGICVIIMEAGKMFGFLSGVVTCILGWLFIPDKFIALIFTVFLSYYPLIKILAEQKNRLTEWIIKLVYFYIITTVSLIIFGLMGVIPDSVKDFLNGPIAVITVTGVVLAECVFDYALSLMIGFYISRIRPVTGKNRF